MEEGVGHEADATTFRECLALSLKNPYVLRLAFSAGIGVISGALLYLRDDVEVVDRLTIIQESIVSMAVAGAIVGAAIGGLLNDKFGRRTAILIADLLFFIGAIIMALTRNSGILIVGRVFAGLGVGMASMTASLYISEVSPAKIRGALVSTNGFVISGGQFLSHLINLAFAKAPGTWRWMLGLAVLPALIQFVLMLLLPESPRWLFRKGKQEEAKTILKKIYTPEEVEKEIQTLKELVEKEIEEKKTSKYINFMKLCHTKAVRRGLIAGVGLQVFQQFLGINIVMYYNPTIIQMAGIESNETALLLSLVIPGLDVFGSIVSIYFIDKNGRIKLLLISLCGIGISMGVLSPIFHMATSSSPTISREETSHFATNLTCPAYHDAGSPSSWDCIRCLQASPSCGFCVSPQNKVLHGACLIVNDTIKDACHNQDRLWYTIGCPSRYGWPALVALVVYILFFSPGMGTIPWIVNSELYPLRFRGVCGGIAATANWISNLIVAQSFLSLTHVIGTSWTFLVFGVISVVAFFFVLICVPETRGVPIEEIEKILERRGLHMMFWKKMANEKNGGENDTKKEGEGDVCIERVIS